MHPNRALTAKGILATALLTGLLSIVLNQRDHTPTPTKATSQAASVTTRAEFPTASLPPAGQTVPGRNDSELFHTADRRWIEPAPEAVFARFHDWAEKHINAPASAKAALEAEGIELAKQRRQELAVLIQADPRRALELSVPVGVRRALPDSVNSLLEERVSQRGNLSVLAALAEPGRESEVTPVVRTATFADIKYDAFVYGRRLGEPTRNYIPLNGIAVDNFFAVNVNPVRVLEADEAAEANATDAVCDVSGQVATLNKQVTPAEVAGSILFLCKPDHAETLNNRLTAAEGGGPTGGSLDDPQASIWTEGTKKVIVIRVDFPDLGAPSLTETGGATLVSNLHNFYNEMSYGKAGFTLVGSGSEVTPVFRMTNSASWYGTNNYYNQLRSEARAAATAAGYVLGNYDRDLICFGSVPGWSWAGLGYVGAAGSWLRNSFGTGVAAHELGHNWGLNHANYWNTTNTSIIGPGASVEYGDSFDTMGSASAGNNHFNARYKTYLNWLTTNEMVTATSNGTYRIVCHDNPLSTGVRGLKVVRNASTNYTVEFRQKFTSNKWMMSGAGLRWTLNGNQYSYLLDTTPGSTDGKTDSPLVIGRTFSDPTAGIHITPVRKGGTSPESLDVVVNLGSFPGNVAPTVNIASSATNVATGVTAIFSAAANDANGDDLAYYWDFGDRNFGTNGVNASKSWATAGDYTVRCVVSDMKGGIASKWLIVRVGSPTTFRITGNITDGSSPVEGARVYVSTTRMGYSDSDGNYAVVGLPAGSYNVAASLLGYAIAPANFTNAVSVGPDKSALNFLATATSSSPPSITTQPVSLAVNPGSSAAFTVAAGGANPLSYQWRFNSVNIAGSTSSSYTKSNVQATNAGGYSVVVSNAYGTATSATATLTVNTPPAITAQPQGQTVIAGSPATFSVTATGSTPLAYQWRLNGTNVPGATSSSYTRNNAQPGDAGNLTVVVTNALGSVTSSPAALTVNCTLIATAASGGTVIKSPDQTSYAPNTVVTLTASHPSFTFTGWSGSADGSNNPLVVVMTTNLTINANFLSPVEDLIVDNPEAAASGSWATDTSAPNRYNADCRTAGSVGGSATATSTFAPNVGTAGFYDVFIWTPTIARGATAVPVMISGNGTNLAMNVNQASGSGGWQLLATNVPFASGTNGFVRVSNNAGQGGNKDVVADAVRWAYSPIQPVAAAPFPIGAPAVTNDTFTITWDAIAGRTYRVEYKDNLGDTNWTALPPDVTATGATASKTDAINSGQRFYRVVMY